MGHGGIAHQQRNHRVAPGQCRLDLDPDEVSRVVEPPAPVGAFSREPAVAHLGQHHVALHDPLREDRAEVGAQRDRVHVLENTTLPESRLQVLVEPPGLLVAVVAMISDEDPWYRRIRRAARREDPGRTVGVHDKLKPGRRPSHWPGRGRVRRQITRHAANWTFGRILSGRGRPRPYTYRRAVATPGASS